MRFATMSHVEAPDGAAAGGVFAAVLEQAIAADAAGFDVAWFGEHHFGVHRGYLPRPLMLALAVMERTRLRAGASVSVLPLAHPLHLAEEIAVAHVLSGGRLETGLGSGSFEPEFASFGVPLEERRDRFAEALPVVLRALAGESYAHQGELYDIPEGRLRPLPDAPPTDYLWLAASGVETAAVAGERGLGLMLPRGRAPEVYREAVDAYQRGRQGRACRPAGRVAATRCVLVAPDRETARRDAANAVARFFLHATNQAPDTPTPPLDAMIDFLKLVIGDPNDCRRALESLVDAAPITHLTVQLGWEDLPQDVVLRSIDLLGRHVIPALRHRRPDTLEYEPRRNGA